MHPLLKQFIYKQNEQELYVSLVDCPDYCDCNTIKMEILLSDEHKLDMSDILIIRPSVYISISSKKRDLNKYLKRFDCFESVFPKAAIYILFSENFEIKIKVCFGNDNHSSNPISETKLKDWLRQEELIGYVNQSNALFKRHDKMLYRFGTNNYSNMYLRVGNVQTGRHIVDAFFFWMLPFLKDCTAILTDTWTISSIALNAGRLLERYNSKINKKTKNMHCSIDMLPFYHENALELMPQISQSLKRVVNNSSSKVLMLISAVLTGESLKNLKKTIAYENYDLKKFCFVALYKLTDKVDIEYCLCDLSNGINEVKFEYYKKYKANHSIIDIDNCAYFPVSVKERAVSITKKDIKGDEKNSSIDIFKFFNTYKGKNIISVHKNSLVANRIKHKHHAIYIDVVNMLKDEKFSKKFRTILKRKSKKKENIALIIAPNHSAGKLMEKFAQKALKYFLGEKIETLIYPSFINSNLGELESTVSQLKKEDTILILDDVSISGARLWQYYKELNKINYLGKTHFIVGVARPESEREWERRVSNFMNSTVDFVEMIILPDWKERECPWCNEVTVLNEFKKRKQKLSKNVENLINKRLLLLRNKNKGLIDKAYWYIDDVPTFTRGAMFLNKKSAKEADIFAAIAATLQIKRSRDGLGNIQYPFVNVINHQYVIDNDQYLKESGERFFDPALNLAIIRFAKRTELRRIDVENEEDRREEVLNKLLDHENNKFVLLEYIVAFLQDKLPKPNIIPKEIKFLTSSYINFLRIVIEDVEI